MSFGVPCRVRLPRSRRRHRRRNSLYAVSGLEMWNTLSNTAIRQHRSIAARHKKTIVHVKKR